LAIERHLVKTLQAFSRSEFLKAHTLLASRVASMMGRKFEEGDWTDVYRAAKGLPDSGWSNLNIDVMSGPLGVEHKMLCVRSDVRIKTHCGTSPMHPSATRAIRIPSIEGDATEIARDILRQYAELIEQRRQQVAENAPGQTPDMRMGWLLWQESLKEFLYFENEMLPPNPYEYWAEWKESGGGARKTSKNLWVYETSTGRKRYSITTSAGAKIQPYFDVPAPNDPNLCYFWVQGEELESGLVRLWVTSTTALFLKQTLGNLDEKTLSSAILTAAHALSHTIREDLDQTAPVDLAQPLIVTREAYQSLTITFNGVSDEHMLQLFVRYLSR
jgi:hypothetical protein